MVKVSTWRKLAVVARVAGQQAGRNRIVSAFAKAARATARSFGNVLHQLWLEITGFVFLAFALIGVTALVRELNSYHSGKGTTAHVAAAAGFTAVFAWFGISSFWRARNRR